MGWEVGENDVVMPALFKEAIVPARPMEVTSHTTAEQRGRYARGSVAVQQVDGHVPTNVCMCVCEGRDECYYSLTQREGNVEGAEEKEEGDEDPEKWKKGPQEYEDNV